MREAAATKARRLLTEGRVNLQRVEDDLVVALVRGDSAEVYAVVYEPEGWRCSCQARRGCSHVQAVMLVVVVNRARV